LYNKTRNMTRWGILIIAAMALQPIAGMAQKKYSLSADQAVQLALKQVTDIKNLQIDRELQLAKKQGTDCTGFPAGERHRFHTTFLQYSCNPFTGLYLTFSLSGTSRQWRKEWCR